MTWIVKPAALCGLPAKKRPPHRRSRSLGSSRPQTVSAHAIGDIIAGPGFRIDEGERAAGARVPKRPRMTEGRSRPGLAETKRESDLTLHTLIVETGCRRNRGGH